MAQNSSQGMIFEHPNVVIRAGKLGFVEADRVVATSTGFEIAGKKMNRLFGYLGTLIHNVVLGFIFVLLASIGIFAWFSFIKNIATEIGKKAPGTGNPFMVVILLIMGVIGSLIGAFFIAFKLLSIFTVPYSVFVGKEEIQDINIEKLGDEYYVKMKLSIPRFGKRKRVDVVFKNGN